MSAAQPKGERCYRHQEHFIDVCREGDTRTAEEMIDQGAGVNKRGGGRYMGNKRGLMPLYWASYKGRTDTVEMLVRRGADIDAFSNDFTALSIACKEGHTATVEKLADLGADLGLYCNYSPLYYACRTGRLATVTLLLDKGVDPDANRYGTPLYNALQVEEAITRARNANASEEATVRKIVHNWSSRAYGEGEVIVERRKRALAGIVPTLPPELSTKVIKFAGLRGPFWRAELISKEIVRVLKERGAKPVTFSVQPLEEAEAPPENDRCSIS